MLALIKYIFLCILNFKILKKAQKIELKISKFAKLSCQQQLFYKRIFRYFYLPIHILYYFFL